MGMVNSRRKTPWRYHPRVPVFNMAWENPEIFLGFLMKPKEPSPDLPLLLVQLLLQGRGRIHLTLDILHCHFQSLGINRQWYGAVKKNVVALLFLLMPSFCQKALRNTRKDLYPTPLLNRFHNVDSLPKVCLQNMRNLSPSPLTIQLNFLNIIFQKCNAVHWSAMSGRHELNGCKSSFLTKSIWCVGAEKKGNLELGFSEAWSAWSNSRFTSSF